MLLNKKNLALILGLLIASNAHTIEWTKDIHDVTMQVGTAIIIHTVLFGITRYILPTPSAERSTEEHFKYDCDFTRLKLLKEQRDECSATSPECEQYKLQYKEARTKFIKRYESQFA